MDWKPLVSRVHVNINSCCPSTVDTTIHKQTISVVDAFVTICFAHFCPQKLVDSLNPLNNHILSILSRVGFRNGNFSLGMF
jgi:hypothetical protein